ncbi:MAG TPA: hypothetical protein VGB19_06330 [Actinomycetota bacterium]
MPETFGKRQRRDVKARKAAARDARRVARNDRRERRAAGLPPIEEPIRPDDDFDGYADAEPVDTEQASPSG